VERKKGNSTSYFPLDETHGINAGRGLGAASVLITTEKMKTCVAFWAFNPAEFGFSTLSLKLQGTIVQRQPIWNCKEPKRWGT
jgi:hypothetical protein